MCYYVSVLVVYLKIDMLAGQMLMVGFDGCEFSSEHLELLKEVKPSGIILFGRNMVDSVQVRNLISDFKRSALSLGLPPLIVAVDYEGGVVFRIGKDVTPLPSAMAIGATGNAKYAEIIADVAGSGRVICGTTAQGAMLLGPGRIQHSGIGKTITNLGTDRDTGPAHGTGNSRHFSSGRSLHKKCH